MFSYCLKLKTSKEMGTKSKSRDGLMYALKASKRMNSVTRKHACIRYISATLSYLVAMLSKNSTPLGKNILCSRCWRKKSDTASVPEDHFSKRRNIDHASPKTTLTPNART